MTPSALSRRCTLSAAALLLALSGCAAGTSSDDDPDAASPTPTPSETTGPVGPDASFEVRQVVAVADAADAEPRDPDGVVVTSDQGDLLDLGPAVLEADRVRSAIAHQTDNGGHWVVAVTFDREGSVEFSKVTAGAACATGAAQRVALLVDDEVVSSPQVSLPCGDSIKGTTEISNTNFTRLDAEELASRIAGN